MVSFRKVYVMEYIITKLQLISQSTSETEVQEQDVVEDVDEPQLQQENLDDLETEPIIDHSEDATVDDSPELAQTSDDRVSKSDAIIKIPINII